MPTLLDRDLAAGIPGASLSYWARPVGFAGLSGGGSLGDIYTDISPDVPGNPGVHVLSNGTYSAGISADAFQAAMKAGQGLSFIQWMHSHGFPVAYGNPTTEAQWLAAMGYPSSSYSSNNPAYTTTFASTGVLPAGSEVTYGTASPGSQPHTPSSPPISTISSYFPAGSLPPGAVTPTHESPAGGQGSATGPQGAGVGTGNYATPGALPVGMEEITGLLSNPMVLVGLAVGAFLLLRK